MMMERCKMRRSIWRSNFWRLAAIFVIFIIGLQAVQSKVSILNLHGNSLIIHQINLLNGNPWSCTMALRFKRLNFNLFFEFR